MRVEKRSVSAPRDLFARADARCELLGYAKFSQYVQALIRSDVLKQGDHIRTVAEPQELRDGPSSGYGLEAAKGFVSVSGEHSRGAAIEPPSKEKPGKYPTRRRSKKKPPS